MNQKCFLIHSYPGGVKPPSSRYRDGWVDRLVDSSEETFMDTVFIKYCVFFQKFSKVCHLFLASTRLLLVVQKKLLANRSECTLALR